MTALDVFVFLLIFGGGAVGFVRGFVHEVISLFAWVVGIAMLKLFHAQLWTGLINSFGTSSPAAAVLAFAILFVPSFIIVKFVARSLGGRTRRHSVLGPFDRVLGGGFGALKGLLGATLFFLLANLATDMVYGPQAERPQWMTKSRTYPLLNASGRSIVDWVEARRLHVNRVGPSTSFAGPPSPANAGEERGADVIRLHDTLAREKREFVPADPKRITMYVCGPTVYGRSHIGNARPAVVFDTLSRLIRYEFGAESLVYARNVTDVDDKIIAAAEAEGVEPAAITERYERHYLEDMGALGVAPPTIAPHATQEIGPMVALIEKLIERGNAYEAEGHVLFSVPSDPDYGVLSRRDREQMIAGARVEVAPYKRDPADFVLWKPSEAGVIGWDSPWGRGRPGWHVECSAMIHAHLGETIDIHGGGLDLIFPHHENEIAQSRCAHGGKPLARYWVHNGFVDMAAEKMSKSLGNIVTPAELLAEGHKGETLRLALLSAHYRSPLPWTDALVEQSKTILDRLYRAAGDAGAGEIDGEVVEALADDLNTPLALSRLSALDGAALKASAQLLGLLGSSQADWFQGDADSSGIEARIAERAEAKKNRDFAAADRIRDELKSEGVILEDGPTGTTWRRE